MHKIDDSEGDVTSDAIPDSDAECQAEGSEGASGRR